MRLPVVLGCNSSGKAPPRGSIEYRSRCGSGESQRDSGSKPTVARNEPVREANYCSCCSFFPWGPRSMNHNPERVAATRDGNNGNDRNPFVVVGARRGAPNTARCSQGWAGGHNPVGIEAPSATRHSRSSLAFCCSGATSSLLNPVWSSCATSSLVDCFHLWIRGKNPVFEKRSQA